MLFWGQHGVSKDPAAAVKWLERSAMQMKDPSALYDYSILLMKVLRDVEKKNYFTITSNSGCYTSTFLRFDGYRLAD